MRILSLLFLLAFGYLGAFGQNVYLRIGTGYAIPTAFTGDDLSNVVMYSDSGLDEATVRYGTYGGGVPVTLDFGYQIGKNIAFQLGLGYQFGKGQEYVSFADPTHQVRFMSHTNMAFVQPAIVVQAGTEKALVPYGRVGISLPVIVTTHTTITDIDLLSSTTTNNEIQTSRVSGTSQIGFLAAFGVRYALSEQVSFFVEAQALAQRAKGGKGELTEWTINQMDQLEGRPVSDKEWQYVEELNSDSNNPNFNQDFDSEQPTDLPQISTSLSSLAFKLGLAFHF